MHQVTGRWKLGCALALATSIIWSTLPIALEVAVEQVDPETVSWLRFLVSAIILGTWLAARRALPLPIRLTAGGWLLYAVSLACLIGNYLTYAYALEYVTPTVNQTVIQLAPMFLLLGGLVFLRERFARAQQVGLVTLIAGLALFFNQRFVQLGTFGDRFFVGVAWLVLASLIWATYGLTQKLLLRSFGAQQILWLLYVGASLILWPIAHPAAILHVATAQAVALAYCCFNTLAGYGAFVGALEHWEVSRVGAVLATAPIFTLAAMWLTGRLWPGLVEPEQLNGIAILGAMAVVAGSVLSALGGRAKAG